MPRKRPRGRKVRVDFRQNRAQPRRAPDWTRQYQQDADAVVDARSSEAVRAKGELSRKRTVIVGDDEAPLVDQSLWQRGIVTSIPGPVCRVEDEEGQARDCTVRRVLRTRLIEQRSAVTVGDRVWFSIVSPARGINCDGVIERVEPRQTTLSRRVRRGHDQKRGVRHFEQVIVANADQLLIVASVAQPRLKPHLIDRYLVAAHKGDLRPVLCFHKIDLQAEQVDLEDEAMASGSLDGGVTHGGDRSELPAHLRGTGSEPDAQPSITDPSPARSTPAPALDRPPAGSSGGNSADQIVEEYARLGYCCLRTSLVSGAGLEELRDALRGQVTVLSGQSGVGKSSLINALQPGLDLDVREVSADTEKGRHTTSHARLLRLDSGGYVVDTPGIRQFDLWAVEPGQLEALFIEFVPFVPQCRFRNCTHRGQEGCAVAGAVAAGRISPRRYRSYVKMFEEV